MQQKTKPKDHGKSEQGEHLLKFSDHLESNTLTLTISTLKLGELANIISHVLRSNRYISLKPCFDKGQAKAVLK